MFNIGNYLSHRYVMRGDVHSVMWEILGNELGDFGKRTWGLGGDLMV